MDNRLLIYFDRKKQLKTDFCRKIAIILQIVVRKKINKKKLKVVNTKKKVAYRKLTEKKP